MGFRLGIKRTFKKVAEHGFRLATASASQGERDGLRRAGRMIIEHRTHVSALIITGIVAAALEGGTLGILGLAISALLEEAIPLDNLFSGIGGGQIAIFLDSHSPAGLFLVLVGFAIAAQIFKSIIIYISLAVQIYLTTRLRRDIQRLATNHVMSMSYSEVSKYPAGTIATLIDQSDVVEELVQQIGNVLRAALMLIAYAFILIWMSFTTAIVIAMLILLFWFSMSSTVRKLRHLSAAATRGQIDLWRSSVEYLNAPRLLRIFNGTKLAEEQINDARDRKILPERKADLIESAISPAIEAITVFAAGVFLIMGYQLGGEGAKAAVPTLFIYVVVFYRLKPIIKAFSDIRTRMARIMPPLERVSDFLRKEGKEFSRIGERKFAGLKSQILIRNINFRYDSADKDVINDISLSISVGQTVALVGESGAGKTTLADLLMGLYEPTKGEILIDGTPLTDLHQSQWRGLYWRCGSRNVFAERERKREYTIC